MNNGKHHFIAHPNTSCVETDLLSVVSQFLFVKILFPCAYPRDSCIEKKIPWWWHHREVTGQETPYWVFRRWELEIWWQRNWKDKSHPCYFQAPYISWLPWSTSLCTSSSSMIVFLITGQETMEVANQGLLPLELSANVDPSI